MKLLSMSGFVPEQICDVVRFTGYTGERNIAHYCGYANDYISQVLNDNSIDGAVFPKSCDSSRIIKSYLSDCMKFVYQFNVPARNDEIAVDFFSREIENYKQSLEEYFNKTIDDIHFRIEKINERNIVIGNYYSSLEEYSYADYLRSIHSIMSQPLKVEPILITAGKKHEIKKRVYLIGSFLANENIAEIIESNGLGIVGDNLPESGRIQGSVIDATDRNVYRAIAENILANRLSPTQDNFSRIIMRDLEEIHELNADAVIFVTQKYCEPYDYLYSVYKKRLEKEGIPSLKLTVSDSEDNRKIALSVEAFADMI